MLLGASCPHWPKAAFQSQRPATITTAEGGPATYCCSSRARSDSRLRMPRGVWHAGHAGKPEHHSSLRRTGVSVISMRVTHQLPRRTAQKEELRDTVAGKYPRALAGADIVLHSDLWSAGLCFDLFLPAAQQSDVRIRDAFISYPEGSFEFTFSCNGADYDKSRLGFRWLLNSFRLQPNLLRRSHDESISQRGQEARPDIRH